MTSRRTSFIIMWLICIISFLSFLPGILNNNISFDTDEMYWIQTARILPYMLEKKFNDPYWHENMGFTNFNGAKWYYALTLSALGYTDKEYGQIGVPPLTYEQWKGFTQSGFPKNHALYPLLTNARLLSAFALSAGLSLMYLFALLAFEGDSIAAVFAAILLRFHPTIVYIGIHALADSVFLFGELSWLVLLIYIIRSKKQITTAVSVGLGLSIGYLTSIKINGAMFYPLTMAIVYITYSKRTSFYEIVRIFLIITFIFECTFLAVNPNFFFYPNYTLWQMLSDRLYITKYHMAYFSSVDPSHVLTTIPQRITSLTHHVFSPMTTIFFSLSTLCSATLLLKKHYRRYVRILFLPWVMTLSVFLFLLSYVVFDEQRYFLPILPLIILLSSYWLHLRKILYLFFRAILEGLSNMRKRNFRLPR